MRRASPDFELHPEPEIIWAWLEDRFGLSPRLFDEHRLWRRPGAPSVWLAARAAEPPKGLPDIQTFGMLLTRRPPPRAKPTSVFLQRFGGAATKSAITLDEADAARFLMREPLTVTPQGVRRGYCVISGPIGVLGCGFFDGAQLKSETPKFWREGLDLGF